MSKKNEFSIDCEAFSDFETFVAYMNGKAFAESKWHGSLDAFSDLLRGGFRNPIEGSRIIWTNPQKAQSTLGYPETIKWLEMMLTRCHPSNIEQVKRQINQAKSEQGVTLFEIISEIINDEASEC